MPPQRPNPAAGKRPANRVRAHDRRVNGKTVHVSAHSRTAQVGEWARNAWTSVNATRIRRTAAGTATAGVVCALIVAEAGITFVSTVSMVLIATLTGIAVLAGNIAEKNRATMNAQTKKRRAATARRRTTTRRSGQRKRR